MSHSVFRRLRWTLAAWYGGVFGVLLVTLGLTAWSYQAAGLLQQTDALNRRAAADLVQGLRLDGGALDVSADAFAEELAEARTVFNVATVQLLDASGRVVASSNGAAGPLYGGSATTETVRTAAGELRLYRLGVMRGDRRIGTLVVGHDLRDRVAALTELSRALWIILPLGALLTWGAGAWLAGKALEPIKAAFDRQRRFIADASHELRTPVAIIQAQAEAGRGGDVAQAQAAHEAIGRTAQRMGGLVNGLLLLTRADAEALALDRRTFDLDDMVEETVADFQVLAAARALSLRFERGEGLLRVTADPERMQQVVVALLDNALTHTPAHGTVTVRVGADAHGDASVSVADTGVGIPPDALPHVFERFYRVSHAGAPGSGLGLAIVRAIAEAHHGRAEATSLPGEGTLVRVTIPPSGA